MKKKRLLSAVLALAMVMTSAACIIPAAASSDSEIIFDFESTGWAYTSPQAQGTVPEGGFLVDETWIQDAALPIGFSSASDVQAALEKGTTIEKCGALVLQKTVSLSLEDYTAFAMDAVIDDGAVIYINGILASVLNAKETTSTGDDRAYGYYCDQAVGNPLGEPNAVDADSKYENISLDKALFQEGDNAITVLLINKGAGSSDLFGQFRLTGIQGSDEEGPSDPGGTDVLLPAYSSGWAYKQADAAGSVPAGGFPVDESWSTGASLPIGYSNHSETKAELEKGTQLSERYGALVLQTTLNIPDVEQYEMYTMSAIVDDGAAVFVNGKQAALLGAEPTSSTGSTVGYGYRASGTVGNPVSDQVNSGDVSSKYNDVAIDASLFQDGDNVITVLLLNWTADSSDLFLSMELSGSSDAPADPTPEGDAFGKGADWLWLKNGNGTAWLADNFVPVGWSVDTAPIGYGYPDVSNVPGGNCSNVYLRRIVHIDDLSNVNSIILNLELDDSAVVYFNGVQAAAFDNGTIDKTPYQTGDVHVAATGLKQGSNVISVELKNASAGSSDIYFDMSFTLSSEAPDFSGEMLILTPGANATELGFSWYVQSPADPASFSFDANTAEELEYGVELCDAITMGGDGRFHDENNYSIYKIPLEDVTSSKATLLLDISQNYDIRLSADGHTWGEPYVDETLAGVGQCDTSNRHTAQFDVSSYIGGDVYFRIGDQTTENGYGGVLYSVSLLVESAGNASAAVKIAPKDSDSEEMPSDAKIVEGAVKRADNTYLSYQVTVTGLAPNTEYLYQIGDSAADSWSQCYTFHTQSGGDTFSAILISDPQIGGGNVTTDSESFAQNLEKAWETVPDASFILSAGDQVDHERESEYKGLTNNDVFKSLPFFPTYGNHDFGSSNYQMHYNLPNMSNLGASGSGGDYYFTYGNMIVLSINSTNSNVEEHRQFIEESLAAYEEEYGAEPTWKMVLMHYDIYGAGQHASNPNHDEFMAPGKFRGTLTKVFDEFGIDFVQSGHDHIYTRSHLMKDNQVQSDQLLDPDGNVIGANGTLYLTLSCSSTAKFHDIESNPDYVAVARDDVRSPQFTSMEVTGNQVTLTTYDSVSGEIVDTVTLKKNATKEDVSTLLAQADTKQEADYTADSFAVLTQAVLTAREAVNGTEEASAQLTSCYTSLKDALENLVAVSPEVDKEALKNLIEQAQALSSSAEIGDTPGQYPPEAKDAFDSAIASAQSVYDNSAATQEAVSDAYTQLSAAMDTFQASVIKGQQPDKSALEKAIANAKTDAQLGQYTDASADAYRAALQQAQAAFDNADATQDEIDTAVEALLAAEEALVKKASSSDNSDGNSSTPSSGQDGSFDGEHNSGQGQLSSDTGNASSAPSPVTGDGAGVLVIFMLVIFMAVSAAAGLLIKKRTR